MTTAEGYLPLRAVCASPDTLSTSHTSPEFWHYAYSGPVPFSNWLLWCSSEAKWQREGFLWDVSCVAVAQITVSAETWACDSLQWLNCDKPTSNNGFENYKAKSLNSATMRLWGQDSDWKRIHTKNSSSKNQAGMEQLQSTKNAQTMWMEAGMCSWTNRKPQSIDAILLATNLVKTT